MEMGWDFLPYAGVAQALSPTLVIGQIALVLTCLIYYSYTRLQFFSSRGVLNLTPFPFLGNLSAITFGKKNFVESIGDGYNAFKDQRYFGLYQYHVPTLIPRNPELVRQIMVKDFNAFADRGLHIGEDCDSLFGKILIMLKGSKWRSMRAALTPAFSGARFRSMAPLMAECSRSTMQYLKATIEKDTVLDVSQITKSYVNDVFASCAFGFASDSLQDPSNCLFRLGKKAVVQDSTQVLKFFGYENMKSVMKFFGVRLLSESDADQFRQLFKTALAARREKEAKSRPDFIQTLVDAPEGFSDDDLVAQAVLFYIAGYDTTATLINYFLCEMASNSEVQDKLIKTLDHDSKDMYETVQRNEYLEMCVNETLRLWPIVGWTSRKSVQSYDFGPTYPGSEHELVAPAGTHVWLPIYSLHRDEQYWPNPNSFNPDRFAPDAKAEIKPYTYLPFGSGPRNCLGSRFALQAAKVFLVHFLRQFRVESASDFKKIDPRAFQLRSKDGYKLTIQPRN